MQVPKRKLKDVKGQQAPLRLAEEEVQWTKQAMKKISYVNAILQNVRTKFILTDQMELRV